MVGKFVWGYSSLLGDEYLSSLLGLYPTRGYLVCPTRSKLVTRLVVGWQFLDCLTSYSTSCLGWHFLECPTTIAQFQRGNLTIALRLSYDCPTIVKIFTNRLLVDLYQYILPTRVPYSGKS
jgi:hypothetical protein